jgi:uncharacterized phage protein (TIGR02216 family)
MLAAAARLGVAPDSFWRLSVREWRALSVPAAPERLSRAALEALAQRFPDVEHD